MSEMSRNNNGNKGAKSVILFVTGDSPRSQRARKHLETVLQDYPDLGQYYEIIDVLVQPTKLVDHGIFATPALMVKPPAGEASLMFGDLSNDTQLRELVSYCD